MNLSKVLEVYTLFMLVLTNTYLLKLECLKSFLKYYLYSSKIAGRRTENIECEANTLALVATAEKQNENQMPLTFLMHTESI